MTRFDIVRAWTDEDYRNSLSDEQRAQLPANPAGEVELNDEQLGNIGGGIGTAPGLTAGCCPSYTLALGCSGQACATAVISAASYITVTILV